MSLQRFDQFYGVIKFWPELEKERYTWWMLNPSSYVTLSRQVDDDDYNRGDEICKSSS